MTLDAATLKKLEDAIPALGNVYADLENNHSSMLREVKLQARAALWHWPELVEAAKQLNYLMEQEAKGRYHTMEITKDALGMVQEQKGMLLAIQAIGELALSTLRGIEEGEDPVYKNEFNRIATICEKVMGA